MLKNSNEQLQLVLVKLFSAFLQCGTYPWNNSITTPLHKKGDRLTLQYFTMPQEEIYKDLSDWSVVTGGFTNSLALKVDMLLSSTSTSQARGKNSSR